jgi:hypothetical protein
MDKDVVLQCWVVLSKALQDGELTASQMCAELGDTKCIPNRENILYRPSWVFFEDRPGLAEKFPQMLNNNTIQRPERVWAAMDAAGVRPISEAVTGEVVEPPNTWEDGWLKQRALIRMPLIKRISEQANSDRRTETEALPLDSIYFLRADELKVI